MSLVFTDSSHWYQLCITCNDHEYAPVKHSLCGFLTLVCLRLMPDVLQRACWSQGWLHVCCLLLTNFWTRSFALGYWLLYFSSVLDSDEERKPLQEKDFSSEYVCCLFTLALIGDRQFRQSVKILCWTICWIKHGEAHVISPCLVFAF